jgi:antirestriction protein ArdC
LTVGKPIYLALCRTSDANYPSLAWITFYAISGLGDEVRRGGGSSGSFLLADGAIPGQLGQNTYASGPVAIIIPKASTISLSVRMSNTTWLYLKSYQ